jgi:GNAT superfamily N-acetyltransferase
MKDLDLHIREYRASDWRGVCRVHDRARPVELDGYVPGEAILSMSEVAREDGFFDCRTYVAHPKNKEQEIIGFVSIKPPELTWLYVDPQYHGRGVGKALTEYVLPILGPDAFVLCASQNRKGVGFYRSRGFTIAARFPGEVHGYPCECLRLCLPESRHRERPPKPAESALRLAGFSKDEPGRAFRGEDGVWTWVADSWGGTSTLPPMSDITDLGSRHDEIRAVEIPRRTRDNGLQRLIHARFGFLRAALPFVAVVVGIHVLHSAWVAILIYHLGILLFLGSKGSWNAGRSIRFGWSSGIGVAVCLLAAGCGPLLLLLWEIMARQPDTLPITLTGLGLTGSSWWIFSVYYVAIHPALEEVFWRSHLLTQRRGLSIFDIAFGGYHLLVLPLFVRLHWALICFVVLTLVAWLWRNIARRSHGLAIPVVSHSVANLSTIAAVIALGHN